MVIDTHTHMFVREQGAAVEFLDMLDQYSIDRAVVSGMEVFDKTAPASTWNDRLARECATVPDRLRMLGTVYLVESPDNVVSEARRCVEELAAVGFKLHPWLQGELVFRDSMYALCRYAADARKPIMFHDGTPPYAMCSQIGMLAKMFPETVFVLGHAGILHYWEEAITVALQFSNIYLTLCGGHPWAFSQMIDRVDPSRIMWGSDCIGAGFGDYIAYRLELVRLPGVPESILNRIMYRNAEKLYWNTGPITEERVAGDK